MDLNQVSQSKFGNHANTQRIISDVERASDRFDNSTNFCVIYFKIHYTNYLKKNEHKSKVNDIYLNVFAKHSSQNRCPQTAWTVFLITKRHIEQSWHGDSESMKTKSYSPWKGWSWNSSFLSFLHFCISYVSVFSPYLYFSLAIKFVDNKFCIKYGSRK